MAAAQKVFESCRAYDSLKWSALYLPNDHRSERR